jgi:hypothetical protein
MSEPVISIEDHVCNQRTMSAISEPVISAHEASKPPLKPRGACSHVRLDKAFDKRQRLTEEQKAKTVQHYLKNKMTYEETVEWCKERFKLDKTPSTAALCLWLKPEKRKQLIELLETEQVPAKLVAKGCYKPEHPDLEKELFSWFRTNEARKSTLNDTVLREQARKLGEKYKLQEFKASPNWVRKFKARHGIGRMALQGKKVASSGKEDAHIPAESCTVAQEESQLSTSPTGCPEPSAEAAANSDSAENNAMSLEQARAASAALLLFLQARRSDAEQAQRAVSEALRGMA